MGYRNGANELADFAARYVRRRVYRRTIGKVFLLLSGPLSIILLAFLVVVVLNDAPEYCAEKISNWFSDYFGSASDSTLEEFGLERGQITEAYASSLEYVNDIDIMTQLFEHGQTDINFGTWQVDYTDLMRVMYAVQEDETSHDLQRTATYTYYEHGYSEEMQMDYTLPLEEEITFSLTDIEREQNEYGISAYQLRWQEVMALCLMSSVQNNEDWGYKYSNERDENGLLSFLGSSPTDRYFLSDETIDGIIDILRYDFSYYYNPILDTVDSYQYEDMEKYAYYCEGETNLISPYGLDKKVPALAPSYIGNTYKVITYQLNDRNELSSRVITYRPHMFVDAIKQYIPDFQFDMYLDILRQFPGCEDIVERYEMLANQYSNTETDTEVEVVYENTSYAFPSKGVRLGTECGTLTDGGYEYITDENAYQIYYPGLNANFPYNDYIYISRSAMEDSLLVSDNLTVDQIQILVNEMYAQARQTDSRHDCVGFLKTADGLYRAQEEFGVSVLGLLAIVKQEGVLHEDLGQYGYNYFNYGCYEGGVGFTYGGRNGRFLDCKQTFGDDPSECIYQLIKKIYQYYFIKRNQYTFYSMCFNGFNGSLGSITHSWCPPCKQEDPSFSDPGTSPENFKCWSNLCASYRLTLQRRCIDYGFFQE